MPLTSRRRRLVGRIPFAQVCALVALLVAPAAAAQAEPVYAPGDWPMFNRDIASTRHNPAESRLAPARWASWW